MYVYILSEIKFYYYYYLQQIGKISPLACYLQKWHLFKVIIILIYKMYTNKSQSQEHHKMPVILYIHPHPLRVKTY